MGNSFGHHFEETNLTSSVVKIESGQIVGKQFDVGNGQFVDAFLGIPFAKPPVGELRYQKPQKPDSWQGVRECKKHGPRAPQSDLALEKLSMRVPKSEDCLYLNVFAPEPFSNQGTGKAVLVFVHGGGFVTHTSANYGDIGICRHLCTKDVIVVTLQYRIGMLGFMATGDDNCVPNLGLWDQAFALHWVKDNIAAFGGDPDNITVFGQSAGGASVDMLCLSPYTRDLFSKVIPMGGSASCEWATNTAEDVRDAAMERAMLHGWSPPANANTSEVNRSLMEFLKKQTIKNLSLGILSKRKKETRISGLYFVPIIDGDFLPEPIAELRKKTPKKVCMTGTTEYEGLLMGAMAKERFSMKVLKNMIPNRITPEQFPNYEELRKKATSLYIEEGAPRSSQTRGYIKLLGDMMINNAVHEFAEDMTMAGHTVYLYSFEYCNEGNMGIFKYFYPFTAATHASELPYIFSKGLVTTFTPDAVDLRVLENFTTIFTNFAKYGDPNGVVAEKTWEPLTPSDTYKYLCITDELKMKSDYQGRRAAFWRELNNRTNDDAAKGEQTHIEFE